MLCCDHLTGAEVGDESLTSGSNICFPALYSEALQSLPQMFLTLLPLLVVCTGHKEICTLALQLPLVPISLKRSNKHRSYHCASTWLTVCTPACTQFLSGKVAKISHLGRCS